MAEAKHVAEALHILHHRAVDIVMCDVTVPGLFGSLAALMRWVREHRPAIKRIVTADSEAILAGAEGYGLFLSKPYRLADLDVDH